MADTAAITTDTWLFDHVGSSNPSVFKAGVCLAREVDFETANASASVNYEFLPVPAGFILMGVSVRELEKCSAGTVSLKAKSSGEAIGDAVAVGGDALASAVKQVTKTFGDAEMLCIALSAAQDVGRVEVALSGFMPGGDSVQNCELTVPYRTSRQVPGENASKGDIYLERRR